MTNQRKFTRSARRKVLEAALSWTIVVAIGFMATMASADSADQQSGTQRFDQQMQPILVKYLEIGKSLAADSLSGVRANGEAIAKDAAKLDPASVTGEHASHYKNVPTNLSKSAQALSRAKTLEEARASFKKLSMPMAMWVTMSKPKDIDVLYCLMAKGSWVQRQGKVHNPYYGAKMLDCGEVVGGDRHASHKH